MAVADRTQQILPGGQSSAPFTYTVPGSTVFSLLAVRASFDGASAAGAYLPCIQVVSDADVVMAQTVGSSVAAGASADVTFAPFLEAATAGAAPSGIQFDVSPQTGNFFDLETSGPSFLGLTIQDNGPGGLYIRSTNNGFLLIDASQQLYIHGSKVSIHSDNDTEVFLGATFDRFAVFNHLNQVIFEVDEDGTIHGKASVGAITWDLP